MRHVWIAMGLIIALAGCGSTTPTPQLPQPTPAAAGSTSAPSSAAPGGTVFFIQFDFTTQTADIWQSPPAADPIRVTDCVTALCTVQDIALASDGTALAYVVQDNRTFKADLQVRTVASGAETTLRAQADYLAEPRFSPDGRQIAFIEGRNTEAPVPEQDLLVLERDSGTSARLLKGQFFITDLAWQSDSAAVLFSQATMGTPPAGYGIYRAPLDGSPIAQIVGGARLGAPAPHADQWAILPARPDNLFTVALYDVASDQVSPLVPDTTAVTAAAWSPGGRLAVISVGERGTGPTTLVIFPARSTEASYAVPISTPLGNSLAFADEDTLLVETFDPSETNGQGLLQVELNADTRADQVEQRLPSMAGNPSLRFVVLP